MGDWHAWILLTLGHVPGLGLVLTGRGSSPRSPAARIHSTRQLSTLPSTTQTRQQRRASPFQLALCSCVPSSPAVLLLSAIKRHLPANEGRQQQREKASITVKRRRLPTLRHHPFIRQGRPVGQHPLSHCITSRTTRDPSRPAQRLPKNSTLLLPETQPQHSDPPRFLCDNHARSLFTSRPPWLTRRTPPSMSSTPSPC